MLSRLAAGVISIFLVIVGNLFGEQTTVTLQEKWSGSTLKYNVDDVAFNWKSSSKDPRAFYWFKDCPG